MVYQGRLVNQEVLRTLVEDYLGHRPLPEEYQNYLLRLIEGQVDILIHNLLQGIVPKAQAASKELKNYPVSGLIPVSRKMKMDGE